MARFVYSMQSILNIKEKEEAQFKMDFAVAKRRLDDENEILLELINRRRMYQEKGVALREKAIDVMEIRENETAIDIMNDRIATQQLNVQRAEQALEREREKLTATMQERQMHERLRERAFEAYLAEEKAEEAKIVDERSSFVYGQGVNN
ncbi:MAG: flagellar export protein FliJ [Lachnospiraceae bacterium]|nr:flagellar export protein FliJ [Lachnospiraceae bacterium]